MATETTTSTENSSSQLINLPSDFTFNAADPHLQQHKEPEPLAVSATPAPPLGVLSNFTGDFAGTGFNTIFRPNSGPPTTTTFPNPVNPTPPTAPSENVLELNLTTETLSFSKSLGSVPNRGLQGQNDIFLNGVPYVQAINDVTNQNTGKADGAPIGIHFEPGLWMHLPATTADPVLGESLVRMASIPHGTTINAQTLAPTGSFEDPPQIAPVNITPFIIGNPTQTIPFASQTAANIDTPRLPQDLSKFIAAGTITQAILDDPNTVLRKANTGLKITNTIVFTVSTTPSAPELGGGTANIAFLQGNSNAGPNANAAQMQAVFWIETVQWEIEVPAFKVGHAPLHVKPKAPHAGARVPTFVIHPTHDIAEPKQITVTSTQIQYSQTVLLNFAGLTWPHASVATLVPSTPQVVSPSLLK
ncbi:MAG: hypothetical protein M1821_009244 [Bathelium mastoideum]|nr:MAG: hypothetical protein M1821_009244 [Bathelium mastoideum]